MAGPSPVGKPNGAPPHTKHCPLSALENHEQFFFVCVFLLAPLKLKAALNQNTGDEPEIVLKLLKLVNCRPLAPSE